MSTDEIKQQTRTMRESDDVYWRRFRAALRGLEIDPAAVQLARRFGGDSDITQLEHEDGRTIYVMWPHDDDEQNEFVGSWVEGRGKPPKWLASELKRV